MSVRALSKPLQGVAIKELNEDPQRIQSDLAYLKEWLSKQPHLKARTDDQFLIAFLRGTKYSFDHAKEKLDMHYTLKTVTPELFHNRDPFAPEVQKILEHGVILPLPKLISPDGPRIILVRNGVMEKYNLDQAAFFKLVVMYQDIMLAEDDNVAVSGFLVVEDMSDVSLAFIKSMPLSLIKKAMTCYQQGYPLRIKGEHFFNLTGVFELFYNVFKPFLTEELKQKLCIHQSLDELYKVVPKEILPEEYGGDGGKVADIAAYWKSKVESYKDWFVEDEKFRNNEGKRPGKPKTAETVFGQDVSFVD